MEDLRTLRLSITTTATLALLAGLALAGCSATTTTTSSTTTTTSGSTATATTPRPTAWPLQSAAEMVMTKAVQEAMTPDEAIARLVEGNARFLSNRSIHRDLLGEVRETSHGQYPFAVVLSCIDSRTPPELIFDQGIGDIFVPRIAGNYAPTGILGSMEFATAITGAKAVVVVGHTNCGAIKGACDNVQMGNLTKVIQSVRPAVEKTPGFAGERTSKNLAFVDAVATENVRLVMETIRRDSEVIRGLESQGKVKIVGAMQDIATGKVTFLD